MVAAIWAICLQLSLRMLKVFQEGKPECKRVFYVSACIIFGFVPSAKESHMAKLSVNVEVTTDGTNTVDTGRFIGGRYSGNFSNLGIGISHEAKTIRWEFCDHPPTPHATNI